MKKKIILIFLVVIAIVICSTAFLILKSSPSDEEYVPKEGDDIIATDYSDINNWLTVAEYPDEPVDVFVLYPTMYSPGEGDPIVAFINNEGMRTGALGFVDKVASAFNTAGNMFAPYYRQLDAVWTLTLPAGERDQYINGVPKTDVTAAFDHYIQNFNNGRPFIIVGHSQGSSMAKALLFDYMSENPTVYERLVAAYVIGYSVTQDELDEHTHLKFAENATDTGVIISYNTVSEGFTGELSTWLPNSIAINPMNWSRTDVTAEASANRGSFVDVGNGYEKVMGLADATVDTERGLLICSTADVSIFGMPESAGDVFPRDSFHGQDISFYYFDLRKNAEDRVQRFLADNPIYNI